MTNEVVFDSGEARGNFKLRAKVEFGPGETFQITRVWVEAGDSDWDNTGPVPLYGIHVERADAQEGE